VPRSPWLRAYHGRSHEAGLRHPLVGHACRLAVRAPLLAVPPARAIRVRSDGQNTRLTEPPKTTGYGLAILINNYKLLNCLCGNKYKVLSGFLFCLTCFYSRNKKLQIVSTEIAMN